MQSYYFIPILIITTIIFVVFWKAFTIITSYLNSLYVQRVKSRIIGYSTSQDRKLSRDCTSLYQGLYRDQVQRYSNMIKSHITCISFYEYFKTAYPDGLVTHSRIRGAMAYLVYGVPSLYKIIDNAIPMEEQIVPKGDTCIPIHKTLNQITRYFEHSYIKFDPTLEFHRTMESIIVDRAGIFNRRVTPNLPPIRYYNRILDRIQYDTIYLTFQKIRKYISLYSDLTDRGFEVIDLNNRSVRLFVRVPPELNLDYLTSITTADTLTYRRSATEMSDHRDQYSAHKIRVYYPLDNLELEDIIRSFKDHDPHLRYPIVITQINSIFPSYNYKGMDIERSRYFGSDLIRNSPTMISHYIQTMTDRSVQSCDHRYRDLISDAMGVFDLIKDSGLLGFGTIDIQLGGVMTILGPPMMVRYDRLDLSPTLRIKLIDPICYPYSFHRIYDSLCSDKADDENITRIRSNPMMMSILNELNLIDLYVDNDDETSHPIFSERVRIYCTAHSEISVDTDLLTNILTMRSRVFIGR
jgi:hypothetical protein